MTPDNLVLLAKIGRAHGLRGECYLQSHTTPAEAVFALRPLQTKNGTELVVEKWRPTNNGFLVLWRGAADRNAASRLTNQEVFIKRQFLPATAANQHYQHDLVGFAVVATPIAPDDKNKTASTAEPLSQVSAGQTIGQVVGFTNYGAGDIMVIKNHQGEEVFLPWQASSIIKIITAEKKIIVAQEFLL
ncbi:MAG: ribosome maturation factor RimM [Hydrotalea sp.]|nr:ribosome maturation factor RimM [Hydrotalea sp.]